MTDAQADLMEAINRKAGVKKAKDLLDTAQQEYVQADLKARAQEETVRKVNQKVVDKAMDVSCGLVVESMSPLYISWKIVVTGQLIRNAWNHCLLYRGCPSFGVKITSVPEETGPGMYADLALSARFIPLLSQW